MFWPWVLISNEPESSVLRAQDLDGAGGCLDMRPAASFQGVKRVSLPTAFGRRYALPLIWISLLAVLELHKVLAKHCTRSHGTQIPHTGCWS